MLRLRKLSLLAALACSPALALSACDSGKDKAGEKKDEEKKEEKEVVDVAEAGEAEAGEEEAGAAGEAGTPIAEAGVEEEAGLEEDEGDEDGPEEDSGEGMDEDAGEDADEEAGEDGAEPAAEGGDETPIKKVTKKVDKKPPVVAKADAKNGKTVFLKKCKSCHAPDGGGDTKLGKKYEIESLKKTKLSTAKIVSILNKGIPDTKMKSYKSKLTPAEMDDIAAFVKTL